MNMHTQRKCATVDSGTARSCPNNRAAARSVVWNKTAGLRKAGFLAKNNDSPNTVDGMKEPLVMGTGMELSLWMSPVLTT